MTVRRIRTSLQLRRLAAVIAMAVTLAMTAGCQWTRQQFPQTTLEPTSQAARDIDHILDMQVFWVVVIFVLVQGLIILAVLRFRARPGAPEPKHVHGNTAMEIAWTVAPAIVLALVAVPTVKVIFQSQAKAPAGSVEVKAIGHQWWWEFQYPDLGITTGSEMHVPVGQTVNVTIETADVLHSFWFPAIGGKRDAVPTHSNHIWFKPESTGVFLWQCAELCGISHANMRMKLFVDTPEEYDAWVAAQKQPAATPDSATQALAFEGSKLFTEQICFTCHTINGVDAAVGVVGPNLTHVGSRTAIAGAIFPNTADNLAKWIADAPHRKPGAVMMKMDLTDAQLQALVAYVQSLR